MFQTIATQHRRKTAALLFAVLYLNLTLPVAAHALWGPPLPPRRAVDSHEPIWPAPVRFAPERAAAPAIAGKVRTPRIVHQKPMIGGPGQPEMSSFKSVNANDMVDLFSGDFSYNIPLMDVGGYPVNIHYNSNVSMDQEASWVGLGWNINPGTIGRSVRGLPDDFDGSDSVTKVQSMKPNKTVGVNLNADLEALGLGLPAGVTLGVFHNTYNGWGVQTGVNVSISLGSASSGSLTGELSLANNSQSGTTISPSIKYQLGVQEGKNDNGRITAGLSTGYSSRSGISSLQLSGSYRQMHQFSKNLSAGIEAKDLPLASISFATPSYTPSINMPYLSTNYSFRARVAGIQVFGLDGAPIDVTGYVSKQEISPEDKVQSRPAVGYLYYARANGNTNTLMDFNREKEAAFTKNTPNIAIPQYTYDIYSISGEGTGGMFRPYRGDIGYVRDNYMRSKSSSDKLTVDLGFGNVFHGGVDFNYTKSYSENNPWMANNSLEPYLHFHTNDSNYQAVYFRNPGEKTTNGQSYYSAVGGESVMRARLDGDGEHIQLANSYLTFKNGRQTSDMPLSSDIVKKERDKRSQVISALNAEEASIYGLDKPIYSYPENEVPGLSCQDSVTVLPRYNDGARKKNHLSQITVLNGDGRRYVYGIPAYNLEQKDVSFSIDPETNSANIAKGLAAYASGDNTPSNNKGKEGYFSEDITPAYAHSFLLTGIVSSDYVDLKSDGITEDDMGDAVKFNYTRVYGGSNPFAWRTPYNTNMANGNEGLKTYNRDDKASYIYGKKEVWYLNSIESKTMIAVFRIARDRKDIYSVAVENGGLDTSKKLARLTQIDLYTKADLVKRGAAARPVKTVHFSYSYSLCKGVAGDANSGKLTLDSIWFSYNGNEKGKQNPYVFRYHAGQSSYNPAYNPKYYDRWGNYQDPAQNPSALSNTDYPYAQQDSALASNYASVWTLNEINLPSGGKIKVSYEADDYAYVQNKRATQFFKVVGVGNTATGTAGNRLYGPDPANPVALKDFDYVYIRSSVPLTGKADVYRRFLEGNSYIYFKLAVFVPNDKWGSGYEFVPVYAQVEDYGVSGNRIWLKLARVEGQSPLARAAVQFLRLNLPSKAYPNSEPGDDTNVWDVVKMIGTSLKDIVTEVGNYDTKARKKGFCRNIDTARSFVRLNSPNWKKYGGGLRVKKVEVFDNWKNMTGQRESIYGQQYDYTTTENVDGTERRISSGVASYEPMIGAEENPFRSPIPYAEKQAPMAPANFLFAEKPLGESYFPAPSVGYSKVRVRTINTKARSANGWAETEFFTTRDFPTIVENTILDHTAKKSYNPKLSSLLRINTKNYVTLSQGFRIELNDMNGKVKAQASYAEKDSIHPIGFTRNFYKVDNDSSFEKHLNNTVWTVDSANGHLNPSATIGEDIEVMQDLREELSQTNSGDVGVNVDYFQVGVFPVIVPSGIPLPQRETTRFRSAATVKIVQRYGILDSVVVMDKGSLVSTKNLVYDGETGEVVLSRTSNEFNDPIFNFSYPAHWAYSDMGMAYKNIDAEFRNLKLVRGRLYYGGNSTTPFPVERFFESGDEVQLTGVIRNMQSGANCLQYALPDPPAPVIMRPVPMRAWVVDAAKADEGDKGLYFVDEEGGPVTVQANYIRILRSGKRNLLDASVGSIMSMASPIRFAGGRYNLVFDSATRIINTSAVTYKDKWKTDDFIYPKDTAIKVYHNYSVDLRPTDITTKRFYSYQNEEGVIEHSKILATAFDYMRDCGSLNPKAIHTRSYMRFSFDTLPVDAVFLSASMNLTGRQATDLWLDIKQKTKGCTQKSYDWVHNATSSHAGTSLSYLRRMTVGWTANTPFNAMASTTTHQAAVDYNSLTNIDCSNLIQDLLNNTNNGISFEINRTQVPSNSSSEIDYLSTCGLNGGTGCTPPILTVNYKLLEDSLAPRCRHLNDDSAVNPYKFGLLGNWRVDRSYTFYHDRRESDASSSATHIRREGELKAFAAFWTFTDSVLQPTPDTAKWVWNSASSQYSKKGFEVENYDPLGRYNAGLYGYNGTLPVAVAQNSRYRELLYDGFEDYGYKSKECTLCTTPRAIDFVTGNSGVSLNDSESHTGLYSIRLSAGAQAQFSAPVIALDTARQGFSFAIDSGLVYGTVYKATGQGLRSTYVGFAPDSIPRGLSGDSVLADTTPLYLGCPLVPDRNTNFNGAFTENVNLNWLSSRKLDSVYRPDWALCHDWFSVYWAGKLRPTATDNYTFYVLSDRAMQLYVNGQAVLDAVAPNQQISGATLHLVAGQLYDIEVKYLHSVGGVAKAKLLWSRESLPGVVEVIPKGYLYVAPVTEKDTIGWAQTNVPSWCTGAGFIKWRSFVNPSFSPIQNTKLVVSAWVKMEGNDCNSAPALDDVLHATVYKDADVMTAMTLSRTGVRIEGWQRYEGVISVPATSSSIRINATAPSGRAIYVDDIRVQPYNSSMKSYVYDPVTLRLMAELDENNYASFYEYDDDGTLIRVKKETERGVMTVKETRSALLKDN